MAQRQRYRLDEEGLAELGPGMHNDGQGLYLQVIKTGGRSWILRVMIASRRRDLGLGGWPDCSLEVARQRAEVVRKRIKSRKNSQGNEKFQWVGSDFATVAESVFGQISHRWANDKHRRQWISSLKKYAYPYLGSLPVAGVGGEEIAAALEPIWIARPETARRVLQRTSVVLKWAQEKNIRDLSAFDAINAAKKILPKQKKLRRSHKSMPYDEIPGFLQDLRRSKAEDSVKMALELLILTARSTGEIINLHAKQCDLKKRLWFLRDTTEPMNTLKIPLSRRAARLIEEALKKGNQLLFPSIRKGDLLSNTVFLRVLREFGLGYTVHGFRQSFKDWSLAQSTVPGVVVEIAVGRTKSNSRAVKIEESSQLFKKRQDLMEAWAWFLN